MSSIRWDWSLGARKLPATPEHVRPAGVLRRGFEAEAENQNLGAKAAGSPVYLPGWARQVHPRSRHHEQMPGLSEEDVDPDPISQFLSWYGYAPCDAVALVTASPQALPSGRMVLLKGVDKSGFVFFTNYGSPKARDLAANPRAALLFFWPPDRQVRVSGWVAEVGRAESERYWRTRPRPSQLSAWASRQSEVIESRTVLEERIVELGSRFPDEVPCPPFWGGYRLIPTSVEFWHHRDDRLHDRLLYERTQEGWALKRLSP